MRLFAIIFFLLFSVNVHALIDWPNVVEGIAQAPSDYHLTPISGGASNINYLLELGDSHYFLRMAPPATENLFADLAVEYDVLQLVSELGVSARPHYYDPNKRILITDFISHDDIEIDLLDPATRRAVIALLHKIENSKISISRIFQPYRYVMQLAEQAERLSNNPLSAEFYDLLLPTLKQIDDIMSQNSRQSLCHLDLHHKNLLKSPDRFWIVDWEYAVMSHPYLALASMASIERWDDKQMYALLKDYTDHPRPEDYFCLYLYRIAADIFWTAWNHIQANSSSIVNIPYADWERLFRDAAVERVRSSRVLVAITYLKQRYSLLNLR